MQYDRARAYRVLIHAEIEACVEDLAIGTLNAAYAGWQGDRRPRTCLMALLAYSQRQLGGAPSALGEATGPGPLRERLRTARNDYVRRVMIDNHGIRERNLLAVLLPVGVLESDIDRTWLSTIDSFAAQRGNTAHLAGRTQQPPDPAQEFQTVNAIIRGLIPIDEKLTSLRNA